MKIKKGYSANFESEIREIFFESSSRTIFENEQEKESFFHKYLGFYLENYPEHVYLALENENLLGYLCGVVDSSKEEKLNHLLSHYQIFSNYYPDYPAHLHMNVTESARGKEVGASLLEAFCVELKKQNIKGLHIITSIQARNRHFYSKNSFLFEKQHQNLLFMGRTISNSN